MSCLENLSSLITGLSPLLSSHTSFSLWNINQAPSLLCSEPSSDFLALSPGPYLPHWCLYQPSSLPQAHITKGPSIHSSPCLGLSCLLELPCSISVHIGLCPDVTFSADLPCSFFKGVTSGIHPPYRGLLTLACFPSWQYHSHFPLLVYLFPCVLLVFPSVKLTPQVRNLASFIYYSVSSTRKVPNS